MGVIRRFPFSFDQHLQATFTWQNFADDVALFAEEDPVCQETITNTAVQSVAYTSAKSKITRTNTTPKYQSFNQYRKCFHKDVASIVQIITVHKIHNSKQLLR